MTSVPLLPPALHLARLPGPGVCGALRSRVLTRLGVCPAGLHRLSAPHHRGCG